MAEPSMPMTSKSGNFSTSALVSGPPMSRLENGSRSATGYMAAAAVIAATKPLRWIDLSPCGTPIKTAFRW